MNKELSQLFQVLRHTGVSDCSLEKIDELLIEAVQTNDRQSELECRLLRTELYLKMGQIDEVEQEYVLIHQLSDELKTVDDFRDFVCHGIGYVRYIHGNNKEALEYLKEALSLSRARNRLSTEIRCLLTLTAVYTAYGNISYATEYAKSASLLAKSSHGALRLRSLLLLAELYLVRGDLEGAVRASRESVEVAERLDDPVFLCRANVRYATILVELREKEKAKSVLDSISEKMELYRPTSLWATFQLTRAKIESLQDRSNGAIEFFESAISTFRELKEPRLLVNALTLYGEYFLEHNQMEESLEILDEAFSIANEIADKQGMVACLRFLGKVHAIQGKYENAYSYSERQRTLEIEIASDEADQKLQLFRIEREVEKTEQEKEIFRLKGDHLEQQLASSTLQLIAQTELLSELRDGLLQFIHKFPLPDGAARELRERLKMLPCKAVDWEKFDTQFKAAHPEFTKKLLERFPDLTPMQIRISSLLRMNLKSEEIGQLLCLTERNIENHRYRIRKKMSLKREEDLSIYLAKL